MIEDCHLGAGVRIQFPQLVNIYRCTIDDDTVIGPFVEIQTEVSVGKLCKIESHTFICSGVKIENYVFIGHGVTFTNDRYPVIMSHFALEPTLVRSYASIGSGATIGPGVTIGTWSIIGAGSTVVKSVPDYAIVAGNPARIIRQFFTPQEIQDYVEYNYSQCVQR